MSPANDINRVPDHVIAVDVGNTRAKFGLFRLTGHLPEPVEIQACVLQLTPQPWQFLEDWLVSLTGTCPPIAAVAGSDPDTRDRLLDRWPRSECQPRLIHHFEQIPIGVDVDVPERVGIDRLLNTFAAWRMAGGTQPVIAVDSGTATTVDLMTADGVFRGGSIFPGVRLAAHALHDYTARLPYLQTIDDLSELPSVPGRNTEAAIRAGLYVGQLGAVRELTAGLTRSAADQFRQLVSPQLFVSGGGGRQLVRYLPGAIFVDSLALHGLAMLAPV